ncbi:MAG: bifunctional transaldolase/phosoglucose isomerase [Chloroflexi bacterium]|nr:bifunctional transaldolase/phosoglucose isomerase [Chloroflexota bacterium]
MKQNPLLDIQIFSQSVWLDLIRRGMLSSGELQQLIEEDGLRGVTSNPSIFEKAIAGSHDYDDATRALALEGTSVEDIYQALTMEDVQRTADLFRPIYDQTEGRDGFVSLEVSPHLAYDTTGTISEARRLWAVLDRPNVLIKVPASREGLSAIKQLTYEGINVNVTLLFSLDRYREVTEAYIAGLEARATLGKPLERAASVASFFLSRIDVLVDSLLEKVMHAGGAKAEIATTLHGHVAIASAKVAYQMYKEIFASERFRKLAVQGARTQRPLWASTGTKNPTYSDVKYVEELIGPDTVNTMPLETLNAYRDHGNPAPRLEEAVEEAHRTLDRLSEAGIDLEAVTRQLEKEGVHKFIVPFDRLMTTLEEKCAAALAEPLDRQTLNLGAYEAAVQERIISLEQARFSARLWRKDSSLWKNEPESQAIIRNSLGWLHLAEKMEEQLDILSDFVAEARAAGLRHVVHMGMGGSSLAPLVFQRTFAPARYALPLTVLDTNDPATILKIERELPIADTLFIVASKSGTTAEPLAFEDYFYAKVKALKGDRARENFVAITDPGTPLANLAQERGFRRIFRNFPDIGGRYSALSHFGLVPAALMGVNISELLVRALRMTHACISCVQVQDNHGVVLGAVMGELARRGRDKVTFLVPQPIAALGMWLEQLLAESTGKGGTGILPVAGEPLGDPSVYGDDRLFVHIRLRDNFNDAFERGVEALREVGQPVVTIQMEDRLDLGQEFFRWELATATIGAILEINPFDQPNVQESKDNTNRLLNELRQTGKLPEHAPTLSEGPLRFYAAERAESAKDLLRAIFAQARPGDYLALQAYLTETPATEQALQAIRLRLRDSLRLATTLGYGPCFLHSTGQFHKGGPNTGLFLQLTADDIEDAPIPGAPYTFGMFRRAQALGDLEALRKHGRRVVHVHLGADVGQGLAALGQAMEAALAGDAG